MREKCPRCSAPISYKYEWVEWSLPFGDTLSEPTWVERCTKCGWHNPFEAWPYGNKCPICNEKFDENGNCPKCQRWVFDFAVPTTRFRDDLEKELCGNCPNNNTCKYFCAAYLSIRRMLRRQQISMAHKYGGIPIYRNLLIKNDYLAMLRKRGEL